MKNIMTLLILATLTGCATSQSIPTLQAPPAPSMQSSNPIRPIQVDCQFGLAMTTQLEHVIASPGESNSFWDPMFNQLHGSANRDQRRASAKYVLWSIRTQCQGY